MSKIASTQIVPLKHVFVKPNAQAKHRLSYAMARKRRMKINPERDGASLCQKGKNRIFCDFKFLRRAIISSSFLPNWVFRAFIKCWYEYRRFLAMAAYSSKLDTLLIWLNEMFIWMKFFFFFSSVPLQRNSIEQGISMDAV